jgi:hypothetical protein
MGIGFKLFFMGTSFSLRRSEPGIAVSAFTPRLASRKTSCALFGGRGCDLDLSAIYGSYEAKDGRGQPAYALERDQLTRREKSCAWRK